jgi:hypothetical protein
MQAKLSKAERKASQRERAYARPAAQFSRRTTRKAAQIVKKLNAQSWESVAKVYASPEGITKTRDAHKVQVASLRIAKCHHP